MDFSFSLTFLCGDFNLLLKFIKLGDFFVEFSRLNREYF